MNDGREEERGKRAGRLAGGHKERELGWKIVTADRDGTEMSECGWGGGRQIDAAQRANRVRAKENGEH